MSEYIDNVTRRKEVIKNVLRQLHEGKTVEDVLSEFGSLASEASYNEIVEAEQALLADGVPVEEIQNLCDVHVAVFRASLDESAPPEETPGHPVNTLIAENQIAARLLEQMRQTLDAFRASGQPQALASFRIQLEKLTEIRLHYLRKENLLFPYLEKKGFTGPSKVMWGIHDQIRAKLKNLVLLSESGDGATTQAAFDEVSTMISEMIYKEEKILIPASLERLSDMEWAAIRMEEDTIGFFLFAPAKTWRPAAAPAATPAETPAPAAPTFDPANLPEGLLPLSTGALSLEQINMLLCGLPVDVTYVDENDTVRYFSQGRERIFDRTEAIIGREVQNCHPPQSVHRVQQILNDFRAGTRQVAEFWIQMGPRFIHIRYFPLHDAAGKYRGTLEVSQDVTGIRALQGERRLLDA